MFSHNYSDHEDMQITKEFAHLHHHHWFQTCCSRTMLLYTMHDRSYK